VPSGNGDLIRILDVDPELGYGLEAPDRDRARQLAVARAQAISPGPWSPDHGWAEPAGQLGLLGSTAW
jgi:hypothetical protein